MSAKFVFILTALLLTQLTWARSFRYSCLSQNQKTKIAEIIFPKHSKSTFEFDRKVIPFSKAYSVTEGSKNRFCFNTYEGFSLVKYCADQDLFNGFPHGEITKKTSVSTEVFSCQL